MEQAAAKATRMGEVGLEPEAKVRAGLKNLNKTISGVSA
jgi:hypothetical protein